MEVSEGEAEAVAVAVDVAGVAEAVGGANLWRNQQLSWTRSWRLITPTQWTLHDVAWTVTNGTVGFTLLCLWACYYLVIRITNFAAVEIWSFYVSRNLCSNLIIILFRSKSLVCLCGYITKLMWFLTTNIRLKKIHIIKSN